MISFNERSSIGGVFGRSSSWFLSFFFFLAGAAFFYIVIEFNHLLIFQLPNQMVSFEVRYRVDKEQLVRYLLHSIMILWRNL